MRQFINFAASAELPQKPAAQTLKPFPEMKHGAAWESHAESDGVVSQLCLTQCRGHCWGAQSLIVQRHRENSPARRGTAKCQGHWALKPDELHGELSQQIRQILLIEETAVTPAKSINNIPWVSLSPGSHLPNRETKPSPSSCTFPVQ